MGDERGRSRTEAEVETKGRSCVDWMLVGMLGAAAVGLLVIAPTVAPGVLLLLVLAGCPVWMAFMRRGMQGMCSGYGSDRANASDGRQANRADGGSRLGEASIEEREEEVSRRIAELEEQFESRTRPGGWTEPGRR